MAHGPPTTTDPQEFWDELYRRRDPSRPGRPHPYLADAVAGGPPGTALELGCGDGANAIWLASQGWTVTGLDISSVALELAAAHAARAGVAGRIDWQQVDLGRWTTAETFDLVAALFVHTPLELDSTAVLAHAAARVRPGGALVIVAHHTLPPWAWDPGDTDGLPSAGGLVRALGLHGPRWRVRLAEEVERAVTGHDGQQASVLDAVVHAVRAPER